MEYDASSFHIPEEIKKILFKGQFNIIEDKNGLIKLTFKTDFGYETAPMIMTKTNPIIEELRNCLEFSKALEENKKITAEYEDLSSTEWR